MVFEHDLLLKGGEVVDPSQGLRALRDVAFKDGRVAAIAEKLDATLHQHMSIFLEMGMSLDEVVGAVTSSSAAVIGRDDLGSLKVGSTGDAAVLELQDGDFGYEDGLGNTLRASRSFGPVLTVKDGRHWRARLFVNR